MRVSRKWLVFTYFDTESIKNRTHEFRRRFNGKRSKWTLDSQEVKEVSQSAGFEVVRSIWLSRLFSGHRYVLLRRSDSGDTGKINLTHTESVSPTQDPWLAR
jgi:hypothetical protein